VSADNNLEFLNQDEARQKCASVIDPITLEIMQGAYAVLITKLLAKQDLPRVNVDMLFFMEVMEGFASQQEKLTSILKGQVEHKCTLKQIDEGSSVSFKEEAAKAVESIQDLITFNLMCLAFNALCDAAAARVSNTEIEFDALFFFHVVGELCDDHEGFITVLEGRGSELYLLG
jgi:hypothetical protein